MNPINILAVSLAPLALSLVFSGNLSAAESYHRWKDENGVTHYGSTPPTGVNSEKINARATPKTKAKDVVDDSTNLENTKKLCLLYTSPSPRDRQKSRMPSSA